MRGMMPKDETATADGVSAADRPMSTQDDPGEAQYRQFVLNGCLMLYDQKVFRTVVSKLRRSEGTGYVKAVAEIAVMLVRRLQKSAPQKLDPNVMIQGGTEIIEEIADISKVAKIHEFTDEEKKSALYMGIDMVRNQMDQAGEIDQKSAQAEWGELQAADASGALDDEKLGLKKEFENVDTGEPQRPGMPEAGPERAPPPRRRGLPAPGMSSS